MNEPNTDGAMEAEMEQMLRFPLLPVQSAVSVGDKEYLCPKCGRDIFAYHQTREHWVRQQIAEGMTTCDLTESEAMLALVDALRTTPPTPPAVVPENTNA